MDNNTMALIPWHSHFHPSIIPEPLPLYIDHSNQALRVWLVSGLCSWASAGVLTILSSFMVTYLVTLLRWNLALQDDDTSKKPPMVPYWIPLLGHAISFLWDTAELATSIV